MTSCPACGVSVADNTSPCPNCGARIGDTLPASLPAALTARRTWPWILLGVGALALGVAGAYVVALLGFGPFGSLGTTSGGPIPTPVSVGVARPLTTALATQPAAATPTALLSDDFASEESSTFMTGGDAEARYSFQGGAYQIDLGLANQLAWSQLSGSYDNASFAVDATLREGPADNAAALLFRYQDSDNFYIFNVAANGTYSLELRRNSQWTHLIDWTASPAVRGPNQANRLRVDAAGDTFTLYVNDTLLGATTDGTFQRGKLALAVNTFEDGGARVAFDNLLVQGN